MQKYRTYHFTTCTDSGYELDIYMTEDDIVDSDWGRNYFLTAKNPSKENCIERWRETFMADLVNDEI